MRFLRFLRRAGIAVALLVLVVLNYPMRSGKNLRDAVVDEYAQQWPYALDIVQARHPEKAESLRPFLLTNHGQLDPKLANDFRQAVNRMDILECYFAYYYFVFDANESRNQIADTLDKN
jgi:hypothetical protein